MLTKAEIRTLLAYLQWAPIYTGHDSHNGIQLSEKMPGYQDGPIGELQAKLSVMLAAAE